MAHLAMHMTPKALSYAIPKWHLHVAGEALVAFAIGAGLAMLLAGGRFYGAALMMFLLGAGVARALSCHKR